MRSACHCLLGCANDKSAFLQKKKKVVVSLNVPLIRFLGSLMPLPWRFWEKLLSNPSLGPSLQPATWQPPLGPSSHPGGSSVLGLSFSHGHKDGESRLRVGASEQGPHPPACVSPGLQDN